MGTGETWGERAEAEIPRGGILSTIGGGLKKVFENLLVINSNIHHIHHHQN
mgnify:CR=1 FL=1